MRLPRFPFWLMLSIAITFLFTGSQANVVTRVQHNWIGSVLLLGVSIFYNGRFGFVTLVPQSRGSKVRVIIRVLGIVIFALGIVIQMFLYFLPRSVVFPLGMVCALIAPACLYFSYTLTKRDGAAVNRES
jgi:hypothetical protein